MPTGPAARLGDPVDHPLPPVLTGGTGSPNVFIGGKPAWRGMPAAAAAAVQAAKQAADIAIQTAQAATAAASGTPGYAAAKAAEESTKASSAASMTATINSAAAAATSPSGGIVDIHNCTTPPLPPPIHGPGMVIGGSATVLVNGLPACRAGDTVLEAFGPANKIALGQVNVIIDG